MIAPAPRKPMPVTICAAMRVGSIRDAGADAEVEVRPRVGGDEREERSADGDEQVCAEARLTVAELALDPDRATECGGCE